MVFESDSLRRFGYKQELRRTLSFWDLLFYGLIYMVPIAPFGIFGSVFQASGGMIVLAYAIGMVAMMFTAASYAQMVKAYPMAGSVYTYAGRGIAPPVGFLAGWMVLLDYVLVPSLLYLVASVAMNSTVPAVPVWLWLLIFLGANTTVNCLGIKLTALVTRIMLFAELAVLLVFIVVCAVALAGGKPHGSLLHPLYDGHTFAWPLVFGAVSVAALSFLGFDGISMLAEENRGESRQVGRAMVGALLMVGVLFMVQTWLAALFVPHAANILAHGDPNGTSFYDAARVSGGAWLAVLTAVATAISWGFANALVAQVSTSRLLYAMARDRQLPAFLAKVSPKRWVPTNAIFLTAAVTLAVGLFMAFRSDGISLLTSLINFGAMTAFLVLHVSVVAHYVVRNRSRRWLPHLVVPVLGFAILLYVVINAKVAAQLLGVVWLVVGAIVLGALYVAGRRPKLPDLLSTEETA